MAQSTVGCDFFYFSTCQVCKVADNSIKCCSGCKLVSYCSKNHQKNHWKRHKELCKCVQGILKELHVSNIFGFESKTKDEWRHVRLSLIFLVEKKLNRVLEPEEKQFFFFPNVCKVCFSANVCMEFRCTFCNLCYYCSQEHMDAHVSKHTKDCSAIKLCFSLDNSFFQSSNSYEVGLSSFYDQHIDRLPSDIQLFLNEYFAPLTNDMVLLSESISSHLSVTNAIKLSVLCNEPVEKLVLHIIGSGKYELHFIKYVEILFHLIASLKNLHITLIGPESEFVKSDMNSLCQKCINNVLTVNFNKQLYHNYILDKSCQKPDMIVAFNCGFSEFQGLQNTWEDTLVAVLGIPNTLFMFTSYTEKEGFSDLKCVKNISSQSKNIKLLSANCLNPFKSLRPHRDWEDYDCGVFYFNQYWSVIEISD